MLFNRPRPSASLHPAPVARGSRWQRWRSLRHLTLGLLAGGLVIAIAPVQAADYLYVNLGLLERSISIKSLGIYVRDGRIEEDLRGYARYAAPADLANLRQVLRARVEISPAALSQFLYSAPGAVLLDRLGEVIRTEARRPGDLSIRSALVLAAADETNGLTPLNVLEKFPLPGIRIDLDRALQIFNSIERVVNQTRQIVCGIEQRSMQEAQASVPSDPTRLRDLRQPGPYQVTRSAITIKRPSTTRERGSQEDPRRQVPTNLYVPLIPGRTAPVPLVVISHGLGSNRRTFAYLAQHLATYGFAVAVPEHPNSNTEWVSGVIDGGPGRNIKPEELIERPLDVTALLDRIERDRDSSSAFRRINTQTVGVIGQSLGGYTALALGGAQINLPQLKQDCKAENALKNTLNVSLVLQCSFLEKNLTVPELRDRRVKAVFAINPLGSSLFGESGFAAMDLPVLMAASGADTVTPALIEQFIPFTWLTTPNRYLMLMQNATHFSAINVTSDDRGAINLPRDVVGPNPAIAQRYLNAMSVAFLGTHLDQRFAGQSYLSAAYVERKLNDPSSAALPLDLVSARSSALLNPSDNPECDLP